LEYAGLYQAQNNPGTMQIWITGVAMIEELLKWS